MSKKICLLTTSLSSGGAEKLVANMSVVLSDKGYNVTIFIMENDVDYEYKGELYNFGLDKVKFSKIKSFFKFRTFFKQHTFDYVIDHRLRDKYFKELIFSKLVFNKCKVIYCIHNFRLKYYFSFINYPVLARLPHSKFRTFVSVSKAIENKVKSKLKIDSTTVYNFFNLNKSLCNNDNEYENYIIGVGRLTEIKQFDVLIESFGASNLKYKNIKLLILGSGPCKNQLHKLIINLNLEAHVKLLPFTDNPYPLIKKAKALVLSSKVEGFPMVLLEALKLNTPVISFNCKSGPNEIIKDEVNGILVEDQNQDKLICALNKLLDEDYYNHLKLNTSVGLEAFSKETIINQWEKLFTQM
ncbi:glycosyltransferase [Seonamhaeicola algicola]|uniref:Glycosyltransferase n=1 Tax=Seonamhaeicola algicola TaxID=1719036 RepID=A0A5C7AIH3_9FLAO|nr:glycosyltransferase [Seonamhaeicola algicola]TXE08097.1 glycosyltransferase [Seonamhaeicola algicola]